MILLEIPIEINLFVKIIDIGIDYVFYHTRDPSQLRKVPAALRKITMVK